MSLNRFWTHTPTPKDSKQTTIRWVGVCWVALELRRSWVGLGLGWVGLGWVGLGWVGLGWVGLGCVGVVLGWVGLGWVELGRVRLG